jgi:hypothetical protein
MNTIKQTSGEVSSVFPDIPGHQSEIGKFFLSLISDFNQHESPLEGRSHQDFVDQVVEDYNLHYFENLDKGISHIAAKMQAIHWCIEEYQINSHDSSELVEN